MKNKNAYILFIIISPFFTSCQDDECYRPWNCYDEEPDGATMDIEVTINDENPAVKVVVYDGVYEDDRVREELILRSRYEEVFLPEGQYSAVAFYKRGKDSIMAIDGGRVKITYWSCEDSTGTLEDECYKVRSSTLNLKL